MDIEKVKKEIEIIKTKYIKKYRGIFNTELIKIPLGKQKNDILHKYLRDIEFVKIINNAGIIVLQKLYLFDIESLEKIIEIYECYKKNNKKTFENNRVIENLNLSKK